MQSATLAIVLLVAILIVGGTFLWFHSARTRRLARFGLLIILAFLGLVILLAVIRRLLFPFPAL